MPLRSMQENLDGNMMGNKGDHAMDILMEIE